MRAFIHPSILFCKRVFISPRTVRLERMPNTNRIEFSEDAKELWELIQEANARMWATAAQDSPYALKSGSFLLFPRAGIPLAARITSYPKMEGTVIGPRRVRTKRAKNVRWSRCKSICGIKPILLFNQVSLMY